MSVVDQHPTKFPFKGRGSLAVGVRYTWGSSCAVRIALPSSGQLVDHLTPTARLGKVSGGTLHLTRKALLGKPAAAPIALK